MKSFMEKKIKKKESYKVDEIINLKIPNAIRNKTGRRNIPCKITKIQSGNYWLGCSKGYLKTSYKAANLEKTKIKTMKELKNIPDRIVTVGEVVKSQDIFCKCPNTQCSTRKCACKKENLRCNSKCHPGKCCYNSN